MFAPATMILDKELCLVKLSPSLPFGLNLRARITSPEHQNTSQLKPHESGNFWSVLARTQVCGNRFISPPTLAQTCSGALPLNPEPVVAAAAIGADAVTEVQVDNQSKGMAYFNVLCFPFLIISSSSRFLCSCDSRMD
jgi:hypothetical protein